MTDVVGIVHTARITGRVRAGRLPPVQLLVDYTTTQFNFRFKLPSTNSVTLFWGDGTSETVVGQDDTLIIKNSIYAAPGSYPFWIEGDVYDITYLYINNQLFVSGSIDNWGLLPELTTVYAALSGTTVNVEVFKDSQKLTLLNTVLSNSHGDVSSLRTALALKYITVAGDGLTFESDADWNLTGATFGIYGNLDGLSVDRMLKAFKNSTTSKFNLAFNANRTAASNGDLETFVDNGNFVFVKEEHPIGTLLSEMHVDANAASDPNGNEADAITGWSETKLSIGGNEFISQSSIKADGGFAFKANANPSPQTGIKMFKNFTVISAKKYLTRLKMRHLGSGGSWYIAPNGTAAIVILTSLTEFIHVSAYYTAASTTLAFFMQPGASTADGGVYVDNLSLREVKVPNGPVQLLVDYTSTQFVFKFKLPSTSTVLLLWGDGTYEEVVGQDATLITKTSVYAAPGSYPFWIEGDVLDLTYIDIGNQAFVSGDISGWSALTKLIELRCYTTSVSGDISGWSALTELTGLDCNTTSVSGDVSGWSALTKLIGLRCNITSVSGDISGWSALILMQYLRFEGTLVTGDVSGFSALVAIKQITCFNMSVSGDISGWGVLTGFLQVKCYSTLVTFDNVVGWSSSVQIDFYSNGWVSEMVDNCLISLANGGLSGKAVNIGGDNAARTSDSDAAKATLLTAGCTIDVNE